LDFFRAALGFEVVRRDDGWRLSLTNSGVGHNVPTGDIFRRLVVAHVSGAGRSKTLAVFEREFELRYDAASDRFRKVMAANHSLRPGQTVRWSLPPDADGQVRVTYHWAGRSFDGGAPQVIYAVPLTATKRRRKSAIRR